MAAPAWLTSRPIAHRGLHNSKIGIVENTIGAAMAAVRLNYAIECDVQLSYDGELVVFHDDELDRLAEAEGKVKAHSLLELKSIKLKNTDEKIPTLKELLSVIDTKVPLICEIKSEFDDDIAAAKRCCVILEDYQGPVAIKSFDPFIVDTVRKLAPQRPRGFIGESHYDDPEWNFLSEIKRNQLIDLTHFTISQPDFISWYVKDLKYTGPRMAREFSGLPLITWTIRNLDQMNEALNFSDQIIFENFIP